MSQKYFRNDNKPKKLFVSRKMQSSLSILGVIAFVIFHLIVTLPLAMLTSRELVYPWLLRAKDEKTARIPSTSEWVLTAVLFVFMAMAFALRGHVVAATGATHVYDARAVQQHAQLHAPHLG